MATKREQRSATLWFPTEPPYPYAQVHALLLHWDNDDLGVYTEVNQLKDALLGYGFNSDGGRPYSVDCFKIPTKESFISLDQLLSEFLDDHSDPNHLLIIYYGGHGGVASLPGRTNRGRTSFNIFETCMCHFSIV